jgi:hypothetical protein
MKYKVYPFGEVAKKTKLEFGETKCPICFGKMPRGFYFFTDEFNEFYVQDDCDFWNFVGILVKEGTF